MIAAIAPQNLSRPAQREDADCRPGDDDWSPRRRAAVCLALAIAAWVPVLLSLRAVF